MITGAGVLNPELSTGLLTSYPQPGAPLEKGPSTGSSDPGFREISGPRASTTGTRKLSTGCE